MIFFDLYREASRITKCCSIQKQIFTHWCKQNTKNSLESNLAFDTETTGLDWNVPSMLKLGNSFIKMPRPTVFGISLAIPYGKKIYLFWGRLGTKLYSETAKLLQQEGKKVAHNLRYDSRVLKESGIIVAPTTNCTLTMARIHWNNRIKFSLQALCEYVCPEISDWEIGLKQIMRNLRASYTRKGYPKDYVNYSFIPNSIISEYAMTDAFVCFILNVLLEPAINEEHKEVYKRERQIIDLVTKVEERGTRFDTKFALIEQKQIERKIKKTENAIHNIANNLNPRSPIQLSKKYLELGITSTNLDLASSKRQEMNLGQTISTGRKVLEKLINHPNKAVSNLSNLVLQLRSFDKLLRGYLLPLYGQAIANQGIVRCKFNPSDTRTGRVASTKPDLMNIPRPSSSYSGSNAIRKCFICRVGFTNYFLDYEQMELVLFGLLANSKSILADYKKGKDLHAQTAKQLYGTIEKRALAKSINFAIIYGMGAKGLASLGSFTHKKAESYLEDYLNNYPEVQRFRDETKELIQSTGKVQDLFGKSYSLSSHEAYKAVNSLVQGSCAQIFKVALINLNVAFASYIESKRINIWLLLHDEFGIEKHNTKALSEKFFLQEAVRSLVEIPQLKKRGLTLRVKVTRTKTNWADKEEVPNELFM